MSGRQLLNASQALQHKNPRTNILQTLLRENLGNWAEGGRRMWEQYLTTGIAIYLTDLALSDNRR